MTKKYATLAEKYIRGFTETSENFRNAVDAFAQWLDACAPVEPTVLQPIATAPMDGTPILGYSDSDFFEGRKTRFVVVHYVSEMQGWSMPGVGGLSITHWAPLPEWATL